MAEKKPTKRVLGRGLDALIPQAEYNVAGSVANHGYGETGSIHEVALEHIETNPYQPRTHFDEDALEELAASIREQGIIQPITVRRMGQDSYQLISGERRYQASKRAGLSRIPAYIRTANDEQMLEMALIENIQRENLNPIEEALGYKRLMDECELTLEQVGMKVGKKRPTINNYLRLLKLPPEIQAALRDKRLSMGHARALVSVDNPVYQLEIFREVMDKDLSVRTTEERVRQIGSPKATKETEEPSKTERTAYALQALEVERNLSRKLDAKVRIQTGQDGSGEIKIKFYNGDDLNRLLELMA
ncbi:MAG: ParB/RepB/Spo0J family partition protein [Bacteroidetes bacterium]|nr:ParB/RepB/Spo0J family partition protein [Bacteroidota bacterium]